ncbi:MAG: TVP38/TMEM64 family protein [Alphaproteobacteria bacterium]|nr:TVP38/TMEM64 family protein [Alphaproteobacteria bacterium]
MSSSPSSFKRMLPLAVLVFGLVLFFAFDLGRFVSFAALAENYNGITAWVAANLLGAVAAFFLLYVVAVAFSLPIASPLTLIGGAVLGYLAAPVIILAATLGAVILFLAARGAFADVLTRKAGPFMAKVSDGFNEDPFLWLLALRLIPIAPFWVVNIVPALLGMNSRQYTIATLVGIAPGTTVYVAVGSGFDAILSSGKVPDLADLGDIRIIAPLIGLGLLALVPIVAKKFLRKGQ